MLESYRNGQQQEIEACTEANRDYEIEKLDEMKHGKRSAVNAPPRKPYYKPRRP